MFDRLGVNYFWFTAFQNRHTRIGGPGSIPIIFIFSSYIFSIFNGGKEKKQKNFIDNY